MQPCASAGEAPSVIHGLDPRTKIILATVFAALVFAVDSLAVAAAQMLFFLGLALLAKAPFGRIFPSRKFLVFLLAMVIVMQALFRQSADGSYIVNPIVPGWVPVAGGMGSLSVSGILAGLTVACRVVALAVLMPLLVMTTEARQLAFGITRLGANYRVAHVITSTLNLARSFEGEARLIMDARRLRGASPGGFFARLAEYRAIALPLMIKVMRRSSEVAMAMDARAFGARKTRTWLIASKMSRADRVALALGAAYCAAVLAANALAANFSACPL